MAKTRVLSGIRATGALQLGNYLHALTTPFDPTSLRESIRNVFVDYLSAGLDPARSTLFVQSMVPQHTELFFLLSTATTMAKMQHLPTFKEKVRQHPDHVTMALFNYPVLMAADILMYKANLVPVGIDQEPHIEVSREIARKMNQDYGLDLPEPQRFATQGEYVPSLTGEGKMSKSVEGSAIFLTDNVETVLKKVRSVPTATISGGEKSGGVANLFVFLELFAPSEVARFEKEYQAETLQFSELKECIADAISAFLKPHQERRAELSKDQALIDAQMKEGAEKARVVAQDTLNEIKQAMGILF